MSLESGTGNFHLCGARSYALAMHDFDFDLLVLGAGSGGVAASRRAAALGAEWALSRLAASEAPASCGLCTQKLLVYGSHFRDDLEDAAGFGWSIPSASLDWSQAGRGQDREVSRLNGVYLKMLADSGVHLFFGWGRLIDAHTVEIRGGAAASASRLATCLSPPARHRFGQQSRGPTWASPRTRR